MSEYAVVSVLVLLLVLLPLVSAVVVPAFGRVARRVALLLALLHLGVTGAVVIYAGAWLTQRNTDPRLNGDIGSLHFSPEFVPGDSAGSSGNGTDGRTTWTVLSLSGKPTARGTTGPNVQFYLGVDGLNLWLVALASVMLVPVILVSWESVQHRPGAFYGWLFVLQAGVIGAFLSFDVVLFYVFFELTLIPSFFLIGNWGATSARRDAARKFFLYTLAGSLLTLVGVIGVVLTNPSEDGTITFSIPKLMANVQEGMHAAHLKALAGDGSALAAKHQTQFWLFLALMAGFMVKVPIWPFHTWLPSAYGEAPTGVTMLLSALMAKLGTFGILRLVLPLVPDAAIQYGLPVIGGFAAFGIVYAALCAYASKDMKLVIAYSSVSHLGFLVLGLFAFNREGLAGSALHMVNHGLSTGALFASLGFLMDRYRTTDIAKFGGLMGRYPNFAILFFALALASVGLPGLNNFVSEMMMLAGLFDARSPGLKSLALAVVAATGIFLSAWYVFTMLRAVFFNPLKEPERAAPEAPAGDVSRREFFAFGSLAALCLVLGLLPQPLLDAMKQDVRKLSIVGDAARARVQGVPFVYVDDEAPAARPSPPVERPQLLEPILKGGQEKGAGNGKGAAKGKAAGNGKGPGAKE
ncbi:NADH-quinone oxidoreductase subunit M [Gemmata obscuriglobus]|uniref:NADH-quinone oxidoreductase subunit N n=1 Tax=Gemmata obscuriglobus TaxID=114 RepID=A0A2Z3H3U9_9BACT|nr:NADH-quinone oxidoreductase subunit M [Gemmata obscuriglobus]AWM39002.1 NADH-quinone oxidoreductase subunit N [Gemmata obscuriglobus]QEG27974.1 NADH-quinone oxidoreductase subunit M [Gemmata obscuriglobus]VTS05474.1 proton-translocating nadh-quinone oxidoreductase subunit m : Proton-translocating NADH-quinone oxidoreductase, chain M OS=Planctomyces limnophilus (strain ATCC 43296 / DSM 3776 / IFAM 1008 / 290) GN=Plim_3869 PE=4 SV=1: Oxidored_q1 [Gemmata obscuriglobus UQM 2246]